MALSSRKLGLMACGVAGLLLLLSFVLTTSAKSTETIRAEGAWVRLPAVSGRPAGGFLTLHGSAASDALVAVESEAAERVELHSVAFENGIMKMRTETSFELPANGKLELKPGAAHLMLFGINPKIKPDSEIPLVLKFRSGASLTVSARTQAAGADVPGGHRHPIGHRGGHH